MSNVDFKNVSYKHIRGWCHSTGFPTDIIKDVSEYHNLELNFSWEESERTCMVCMNDCSRDVSIKELFYQSVEDEEIDEDPIWTAQRDDHQRLEEEE